ASQKGQEVELTLLHGKPFEEILSHVDKERPSLLVLGRLGAHRTEGLEMGSNTENLLRLASCHVLITTRPFEPTVEQIADETTSWTEEAEQRMERVPSFVRNMARSAILRYAHEHGHTVVSCKIVDEATASLLPASAMQAMGRIAEAAAKREQTRAAEAEAERATREDGAELTFDHRALQWSNAATKALEEIAATPTRANVKLRAEKLAFREQQSTVTADHVAQVVGHVEAPSTALVWNYEALARLERVPEGFMRDRSRERVEGHARREGLARITLAVCEAGLEEAKAAMTTAMRGAQGHPQAEPRPPGDGAPDHPEALSWTPEAQERMESIPVGYMRELTRQRVEVFARRQGLDRVTADVVTKKYAEWSEGSAKHSMVMPWRHEAVERVRRIPGFVRGMVIKEAEHCARAMGLDTVTTEVLDKASAAWEARGAFHSDSDPDLYE
ncbi:MAG: universal stress protein, partial [Myxococcota bacterium]